MARVSLMVVLVLLLCAEGKAVVTAEDAIKPTPTITTFTAETIMSLALSAGATDATIQRLDSGVKLVVAKYSEMPLLLILRACDKSDANCRGLYLLAPFKQSDPKYSLEQFNSFNISNPFASAHQFDSEIFVLARYIIADDGVTASHIETNIRIFMAMPSVLAAHFRESVAAPKPPSGEPTAMKYVPLALPANDDQRVLRDALRLVEPNGLRH